MQKRNLGTFSAAAEFVPLLAAIGDGMFLLKDGSLAQVLRMHGGDIDTMTSDDKARQAAQLGNILKLCDEKISLWTTIKRRRVQRDYHANFRTERQQYIHDQYVEQFARIPTYKTDVYLTFIYNSNVRTSSFLNAVTFYTGAGRNPLSAVCAAVADNLSSKRIYRHSQTRLDVAKKAFRTVLSDIESGLSNALTQLTDEETLAFYHDLASPASAAQKVKIPRPESAIDALIADNAVKRHGKELVPDILEFSGAEKKLYGAAITIREWSEFVECGSLDDLMEIGAEMNITCAMAFMSEENAQKMLRSLEQKIFLSFRSIGDLAVRYANRHSEDGSGSGRAKEAAVDEIREASARTFQEKMQWGHCFVSVMVFGESPDEANEHVGKVATAIRRHGHTVARETLVLLSSWYSAMPGRWDGIHNWWPLTVEYFIDLLPIRAIISGETTNHFLSEARNLPTPALTPFFTTQKSIYNLDLHNWSFGRRDGDNGHFFLVAPPGSGKTVLANWIIWSYSQYHPARIIVLDKDLSCKIPILLQGGSYLETGENGLKMNPFCLLADLSRHGAFLSGWLNQLLEVEGVKLSSKEIDLALKTLAVAKPDKWRIKFLCDLLPQKASQALKPWTAGNVYGDMDCIDDEFETIFQQPDYLIGIDMKRVLSDKKFGPICLDYIIYRIEMATEYSADSSVRPGMIYIEEAWKVLQVPRLAMQLEDWLRTLRKRTFVVGLATQSLREFEDSGLFEILNSIPNRFFLGNPEAATQSALYEKFGLTHEDIDALRLMSVGNFLYAKNTHLKKRLFFQMPTNAIRALITNESALAKFNNPEDYFYKEIKK